MRDNVLKSRLRAGRVCRGVWLSLPSPAAARQVARLPCDWLAVDAEHGPMGAETMTAMVAAIADAGGPAPVVRLADGTVENVKRALDAGAHGIIAPMVNSRAQAEAVVAAARFPPLGKRSFGSAWAGLGFDATMAEYRAEADVATLVIVQIESAEALADLDGICAVPGVDALFVGPVDLSISLGLPPAADSAEPVFRQAIDAVLQAAARAGLPAGIYCPDARTAAMRVEQGFLMVNVAGDLSSLLAGVRAELAWDPEESGR